MAVADTKISDDQHPATFNFLVMKSKIDDAKMTLIEKNWTLIKELDENQYGVLWFVACPEDAGGKEMVEDIESFRQSWLRRWTSDGCMIDNDPLRKCIPDVAMRPKTEQTKEISKESTTSPVKTPKLRIIPKVDQTWTIKRIANEACPSGWEEFFKLAHAEISEISDMLDEIEKRDSSYIPLKKDVFNFLWVTKPSQVRVCILAQDPYPQMLPSGLPRAMGLAFSVRRNDSIPSSLQNIYKELKNSIEGFKEPNHGDLTKWARNGVFLPNMCLTVKQNEAGSHKSLWMDFIVKLLTYINERNPHIIYLLLGKDAQKIQRQIDGKITVLCTSHPSGLSCNRGFLGCGHFYKINQLLVERGLEPIDWNLD